MWPLQKMGNVFGSQVETDSGDIRNKEILEARKRYLDEQFKLDDEKEFGNAKPDPSGITVIFVSYFDIFKFLFLYTAATNKVTKGS